MFLAKLSVRRSVLATMALLSLVVIGAFSYVRLTVDLFPPIEFPVVTVVTVYPGAGPEEIESLVSEPIEDVVSSIGGLKTLQSYSQEGVSIVVAEFELGTDADFASMDVKGKVDAILATLPEDIELPAISKFDIGAIPVMNLAVSGKRPLQETYEIADETIRLQLAKVEGLAAIDIIGGRKREISVLVSKEKLTGYGLSIMDVVAAIAVENLNVPGGHITEESREYGVRIQGEFESLDEIRDVWIQRNNSSPVRLGEIADVRDSFEEVRELARFNGQETVGITLQKRTDANTVQVAADVKQTIESLKSILPPDVEIQMARDRSTFIEGSISDVTSNMIIGIILTALVLFLFLHSWEGTVIVGVSIPVSIVATFGFLYFAGFTINVMSLMGLAICIGILVTNSIVVMENIYRFMQMGKDSREAAEQGTSEIALAVLASTMTNVVVFVPIAFMSGIIGQFFRQFGLTVTFATIMSLLVSFTLTPMLASKLLASRTGRSEGRRKSPLARFFAGWDSFYERASLSYREGLEWCLNHRWRVVGMCFGLLVLSLVLVPFIGAEFFGSSDTGILSVGIEMPTGSSLAETERAARTVEDVVSSLPEVDVLFTSVGTTESELGAGGAGVNVGEVLIRLVDKRERKRTDKELARVLRGMLTEIPSAKLTVQPSSTMGGGGMKDIQVDVVGEEMPILISLADKVASIVRETDGTVDVDTSWRIGKPEVRLSPLREKSADYGVSTAILATVLRTYLTGAVASQYRDKDEEYDIRVKLDESDRSNVGKVDDLLVKAEGRAIPLGELASIHYDEGPTQIVRKDRERMITVSANIARGTLGQMVGQIRGKTDELDVPPGYGVQFSGMAEIMAESFASLFQALILAIILTYMLLAALLESYVHPFTIMLTLPLALVGVLLSLFVTGKTISIFSLMALIMLVGIVVNNAILLLDYTATLRRTKGYAAKEALLEACPTRFRPIVMTNVATSLGMLPLALGLGAAAEFRAPMAIVSIGGVLVSASFTLFLIPVIYSLLDGLRARKEG
ncbi:MAG: efflux RND transporter permease subunit [Candidatus Eiseniibacteriota bacterium]|nr:MAG: efflux RND transporter permease subunit [Candidatus Eisenbacteria bacterium]